MSVKKIGIKDIIDDIVNQNKIEFNKKSKEQQNSQKEQISDIIKLALAGRNNNEERQTILIEISKSVNSYSQSFFDSNGNIDVSLLSEVAKSTVKNAERAGVINPIGQTVKKDNREKINFAEVALTAVVIDKLINDYEKLSKDEVNILFNNYSKLTRTQQRELDEKVCKNAYEVLNSDGVKEEDKKEMNLRLRKVSLMNKARDIINIIKSNKATDNDLKEYNEIKEQLSEEYNYNNLLSENELEQNKELCKELEEKINNDKVAELREIREKTDFYKEQANRLQGEGDFLDPNKGKNINLNEQNKKQVDENVKNDGKQDEGKVSGNRQNEYTNLEDIEETMEEIASEFDFEVYGKEEKAEQEVENNNLVKNQIVQIPNELIKAGFSENEIKVAMTTYMDFFKGLDDEDLQALSETKLEKLTDTMKEIFEEADVDKNVGKILGLMSGITYHGNIKEILVDSEKREQFFSELEEVSTMDFKSKDAEVTQEGIEQQFTDGELKQVFNEYFKANSVEMDVSAIEQQPIKVEVVETSEQMQDGNEVVVLNQEDGESIFDADMESVSDEDSATRGNYIKWS